jgi:hypothetical protein
MLIGRIIHYIPIAFSPTNKDIIYTSGRIILIDYPVPCQITHHCVRVYLSTGIKWLLLNQKQSQK